jgi:hypothetical protein
MTRWISTFSLLTSLLVLPMSANATVVLEVGLEKMSEASAVIFQGVVVDVRVTEASGRPGAIHTEVRFRSVEALKGAGHFQDSLLTISLLGGSLHGQTLHVPGMPEFVQGMEVVLFLEKTATGFALTGLHQGVFVIEDAPDGSLEPVVSQRPSGASIARHDPEGRFILGASAPLTRHHPLKDFLAEVRHHIHEQKTPTPTRP